MRWCLAAMLALVGCSSSGPVCTAGELRDALASARPGDTVRLGVCTVRGAFEVGPGVELTGVDPGSSIIEGSGEAVLTLRGSDAGTAVRNLAIRSDGVAGIAASGGGTVIVEDVDVEATRGFGIQALDLGRLELRRARVAGPVTADNVLSQPITPDPAMTATHGVRVGCVEDAELEHVDVSGWALYGAQMVRGGISWRGGSARGNLNTGLGIGYSEAMLEGVEVSDTFQGMGLMPAFGVVTFESSVETHSLEVRESDNYGLLQSGGDVVHRALRVAANGGTGIWAQRAASIAIEGPDSIVDENGFAGVVVSGSSGVRIQDTTIARTRSAIRLSGTIGRVNVGDGLQVVGGTPAVELCRVEFVDNERLSALIDGPLSLAFKDVTVTPTTSPIVVSGAAPDGWQTGIEPPEAVGRSVPCEPDVFCGAYDIVDVVAPTDVPSFEIDCGE